MLSGYASGKHITPQVRPPIFSHTTSRSTFQPAFEFITKSLVTSHTFPSSNEIIMELAAIAVLVPIAALEMLGIAGLPAHFEGNVI